MSTKKVLIIDDEESYSKLIALVLEGKGFKATTYTNPVKGLELSTKEHFDLIILDYQMPSMNGLQVLESLRRHPKTKNTPVIISTASNTMNIVEKAFARGANDYITKPFKSSRLADKVDKLFGQNQLEPKSPPQGQAPKDRDYQTGELDKMRKLGGDRLVKEIVESFLKQTPARIDAARNFCRAQDDTSIEFIIHSIDKSSGKMGLLKMEEICKEIEKLLELKHLEPVLSALNNLENEFLQAQSWLKTVVSGSI